MSQPKDLFEFLKEAELDHYFNAFKSDLKVANVQQIKYVDDEDLIDMGMTKPEMRRLKKFFKKECPQGKLSKLKKILTTNSSRDSMTPPPASPTPKQTSKHIIPEESITLHKCLGEGEFGAVQQGVWTSESGDRIQVAIKKLSKEKMNNGTADFLKEATIMHSLDHDHIVRLHGVVLTNDALMLVTELAPLRSLLECLKDPALKASFPVHQLVEFAIQICDGMSYLENKRFIHRDLAARNILVFSKDKVKVSDFGLSRALGKGKDYYQTNFSVNLKLPIAWCAPESINYLKFTSASDVWAYAVTLWEIFSYGFQPWAAFTGQEILDAIDQPSSQRLEKPDCCPKDIYTLMLKCWEHDADRRPRFSELLHILPRVKPERIEAAHEYPFATCKKDHLAYKQGEVLTLLDKDPPEPPEPDMWYAVANSGVTGFVFSADFTPHIPVKTIASPNVKLRHKVSRKESARKSTRATKKFDASMIGKPEADLRHTGHIGYDGAVFGDVSFIGNNYDKLPIKVHSPGKTNGNMEQSTYSLTSSVVSEPIGNSSSNMSLSNNDRMTTSLTAISTTSSQDDTLTDVSSYQDGGSSGNISKFSFGDKEDFGFGDDFGDFKLPDLTMDLDLGLGSTSLMDDIMKGFSISSTTDTKEEDPKTPSQPEPPTSILTEQASPYQNGTTTTTTSQSFDNSVASSRDSDSISNAGTETGSSHKLNGSFGGDSASSFHRGDSTSSFNRGDSASSSFNRGDFNRGDSLSSFNRNDSTPYNRVDSSPLPRDESTTSSFTGRGDSSSLLSSSTVDDGTSRGVSEEEGSPRHRASLVERRGPRLKLEGEELGPEEEGDNVGEEDAEDEEKIPKDGKTDGMKSMSASEERKINEAIELATELAKRNSAGYMNSPKSPATDSLERSWGDEDFNSSGGSPRLKNMFGLRKKTPPPEKPTFTDGISKVSDVGDDVTPEAQQAYNLLVAKGSDKPDRSEPTRLSARERRTQRALEHQRVSPEPAERSTSTSLRELRNRANVNANIRKPQGIPGRRPAPSAASEQAEESSPDSNPLRRLRNSQSVIKPRVAPRPNITNGRSQSARKPNIEANSPVFDIEQEQHASLDDVKLEDLNSKSLEEEVEGKDLKVPPRHPLKPSTINSKPRERQYPLDLSGPHKQNGSVNNNSKTSPKIIPKGNRPFKPLPKEPSASVSSSYNSDTSNTNNEDLASSFELHENRNITRYYPSVSPTLSPFNVKCVTLTASEMGYHDSSDDFWSDNVDIEELAPPGVVDTEEDFGDENSPIPGRYKTDTVSYEDLLEFALDGCSPSGCLSELEPPVCDEVRLMKRVLGNDVTVEDCMYALEDTSWKVPGAVKLIKLKQLLSTKLATLPKCKQVLIMCKWDVSEAANYLICNPPGQESPELVHV